MFRNKAKRLYLDKRDFLDRFLKHVQTLLDAYYVDNDSMGLEELEELRKELEAAENAFDAAYDGLSGFERWKTQKARSRLKDLVKIYDVDLFYTREEKRLASLHANVKEGLNQLLVQLSLLKPPPAHSFKRWRASWSQLGWSCRKPRSCPQKWLGQSITSMLRSPTSTRWSLRSLPR